MKTKEFNESDQLTFIIWVAPASLVSTAFEKRQYMNVEDGVTFPKALEVPDPEYSEKARRRGIQGTIVLAIAINEKGVQAAAWRKRMGRTLNFSDNLTDVLQFLLGLENLKAYVRVARN